VIVKDAEYSGTLSDLRLTTACLLGYAGFLRFQEIFDPWGNDCTKRGVCI